MDVVALYLVVTLLAGVVAALVRLPPLVGFLAAGFVLNAWAVPDLQYLDALANAGVTILLFTIGLKFDVRTFTKARVWGTASAHMLLTVGGGLLVAVIAGLLLPDRGPDWRTAGLVAFALSFSSTVFVVKVLDDRGEGQSLVGRTAIGILIVQDVAAVAFIAVTQGSYPTPWALALLLLIPAAWLGRRLWHRLHHGELEVLVGVTLALVPGYLAFTAVGLKGDLGALIVGMLLAGHPRAGGLAKTLLGLKNLLLVAFFVGIGRHGVPSMTQVAIAAALMLALPIKAALFGVLLRWGRLRNRTSTAGGLVLANYSEFGIIVAAVAVSTGILRDDWLVTISLAVALSFVLGAVVNGHRPALVRRLSDLLPDRPEAVLHVEDRHIDVGNAQAIVLGMGRIGAAAYDRLVAEHQLPTMGIEFDPVRVPRLQESGRHVIEGDASDAEFWHRIKDMGSLRVIVLAMPAQSSNLEALRLVHATPFGGVVAVVARYEEDADEAIAAGAHAVVNVFAGAGAELADVAVAKIERRP